MFYVFHRSVLVITLAQIGRIRQVSTGAKKKKQIQGVSEKQNKYTKTTIWTGEKL
jgi:hypothetical protein